jgi:hypothetical protein
VMNSDEEDALKEEHGDELEGMYTAGMDREKGPMKLTQTQVAAQKAAAKALPRSQTPVSGSSDDDDPNGSEIVWSQTKSCMRRNKHYKAATDPSKPSVPPPVDVPKSQPAPVSAPKNPISKAAASHKAPAGQKPVPEAKASKPVKGQESPEAKASKPMETRRQAASRAGGLRSVGGSWQTGTCVASGNPSKT